MSLDKRELDVASQAASEEFLWLRKMVRDNRMHHAITLWERQLKRLEKLVAECDWNHAYHTNAHVKGVVEQYRRLSKQ